MVLVIGSWFEEPTIEFKISYKVTNFIREQIIEEILKPKGLYHKKDKNYIGIQVTTSSKTKKAYLSKPIFDKKNNFINYNFWLPYYKIIDTDNELKSYVKYFFIVLTDFFKIYNISPEEISDLQSKVELEVFDNIEYEYEDEDEELDFDQITKDLGI